MSGGIAAFHASNEDKGTRRTDFLLRLLQYTIIFECDENYRRYQPVACKNTKLENLKQGIGDHPLLPIRPNPSKKLSPRLPEIMRTEIANVKANVDHTALTLCP
jgi:hypothetical protein